MSAELPGRLELGSLDIAGKRLAILRAHFPEVFREDAIDFDALKRALGEWVEPGRERFGLSWAGKAEAMRAVQQRSHATLVPDRAESVDFDATQNVIIEGENLEVLKLLQRSYYDQVKMIYIDPPYNTGADFIYPDNYAEPLQSYLAYSGQVDGNGARHTTNTETSGRYHSNWLSMMHPRLSLARNLLREDGVIFVSIDDHEVHNLRALMNEIFGEESFLGTICWQKKYAPANDTTDFSISHDYIHVFAKSRQFNDNGRVLSTLNREQRSPSMDSAYSNPDSDPRGAWKPGDYTCNKSADERPALYYPIIHPITDEEVWPKRTRVWAYSRTEHERHKTDNRLWFGRHNDNRIPSYKRFLTDVGGVIAQTVWTWKEAGHNDEAKKELLDLFLESSRQFDTPKPTRLMKRVVALGTDSSEPDIVLDFFAGSGTTAHAVMKLNAEDGGNRKFILVQLPEPTEGDYPTITRERVRRAGKKIKAEQAGKLNLINSVGGAGFWVSSLPAHDQQFQAVGPRAAEGPDRAAA